MSRLVLACNAGSSSLKLALYRVQAGSSATRAERLSRDGFEGDADALMRSLQQFLGSQDPIEHFLHRIVHAGAVPDPAMQASILSERAMADYELGRYEARDWVGDVDVPTTVVRTTSDQAVPPARQGALELSPRAPRLPGRGSGVEICMQ